MGSRGRSDEFAGGDTITNNAVFALAAQLSTAAFTAAITIFLVRRLGPDEYGVFALALSIAALAILPSDLGASASSARFVAEHRGDRDSVIGVVGLAMRVKIIAGALVSVAMFALAEPIAAGYGIPELTWPVRAMAIALFGQALMQFVYSTFVAVRRLAVGFRLVVSEAAVELSSTVALVLVAGGAAGAAWGRAAGYAFGAVLAVLLLTRMLSASPLGGGIKSPVRLRPFLGYAVALFVIDGAFTVFTQIDVLLIGSILGASAAGLYSAPLRLVPFLAYPGLALARAVAPVSAQGEGGPAPSAEPLQAAMRLLLIVQTALAVAIAVWAEPIVHLTLGDAYGESVSVLRALAPFVLLSGLAPLVSLPINYAGEARKRVPIAIVTVAINIAIDVTLIPEIGIIAGALGTDIAFLLFVGAHGWLCHTILGLRLGPLAVTAARSLLAAGVAALVMVAIGTGELSAVDWILGATLAPAAYIAGLLLTREVSLDELRTTAVRARQLLPGSSES